MKKEKLNVLVILTDQQRWDSLGCNGNKICKTPNLDKLANEGITMTNSFSANPTCTPSRAAIMTGRYPTATGVRANGIPLNNNEITLPETFLNAGYATGSFGKIHLMPTNIMEVVTPKNERITSYESLHFWENYGPGWSVDEHYNHQSWFPSPYYGFKDVKLTIGHTPFVSQYGHYAEWLKENHPDLVGKDKKEFATSVGTNAPQSWKSAMPAEHHVSNWIADETINFIEKNINENKPFMAFCSFPDPHHSFAPPSPYCDMYNKADIKLPEKQKNDLENKPWSYLQAYEEGGKNVCGVVGGPLKNITDEQMREIIAHTYGAITLLDEAIGRVVEKLEELNISDNTLILFTSDHGDMLGEHGLLYKSSFWHLDSLIKVPMIVKLPKIIPKNQKLDGLISGIDIFQTICDFANVEIPIGRQGCSFKDYMTNNINKSPRNSVLIEDEDDMNNEKVRTLITENWKLIFYANKNYGELYDRKKDIGEFNNLWGNSDYQEIKNKLTIQLLHTIVENEDSLLPRYCNA